MSNAVNIAGPEVDRIYLLLTAWSKAGKCRTYTDLSRDYYQATGVMFEPHGSWDLPLGELNVRLAAVGAPALSALVVLKSSGEPGGSFWASAPNVPPRPSTDIGRLGEWSRIVKDVFAYNWPQQLP